MNKKTTIFVLLTMAIAAVAVAPTASADHGTHECTPSDPCDEKGNRGCPTKVTVGGCKYSTHENCTYGKGADGKQSEFCRHTTRSCMLNLMYFCQLHGTTGKLDLR